jgi:hypothetical protein
MTTMTNFQLTEKVPLSKALYINELSFKDFKAIPNRCKNDEKRRICYDIIIKYTSDVIANNGDVVREYHYSKNMKTSGRLFSNGVQNVGREIRGFLMSHTTDIDMKNAHPVILRYICKKHNIRSPELDYYVENRDNILTSIPNTTKDEAKTMFLVALNNDKINKHSSHPVFRKFDNESKLLQKAVSEIPEYKTLCDSVPFGKEDNIIGSKLNRILCHYENEILQVALKCITDKGIEVSTLMFDGCMVYGDHYNDLSLLESIATKCNEAFPTLNMIWDYKKHDTTTVSIPEGWRSKKLIKMLLEKPARTQEERDSVVGIIDGDDNMCANVILENYPHWKYCNLQLYVFDNTTGMWSTSKAIQNNLIGSVALCTYNRTYSLPARTVFLQHHTIPHL